MDCPKRSCEGEFAQHAILASWGICNLCKHQSRLSEEDLEVLREDGGLHYEAYQRKLYAKGSSLADMKIIKADEEEPLVCDVHPWYSGKRRSRSDCITCRGIYRKQHASKDDTTSPSKKKTTTKKKTAKTKSEQKTKTKPKKRKKPSPTKVALTCETHHWYTGKRRSRTDCATCRKIYKNNHS